MPELDDDTLLRDTFQRYREVQLPTMVAPGADAARDTLARRRRRRTVSTVAAAVLVLVAGAGAAVALVRPDHAAHHTPPATSHTPGPTHSPSPSTSPSTSKSPAKKAPNGRIPQQELFNATLDLPAWPGRADCAGRRTFHDGVNQAAGTSWAIRMTDPEGRLPGPRYVDLDGDGAQETVALMSCGAQGRWYQVVAFDRDRHGRIVTMGLVARTPLSNMMMMQLDGLTAGADGTVSVRWTQFNEQSPVSQWRGYRWNGTGFDQVSGPAALPDPPTVSLDIRSEMSAADDGYAGTLTIVVANSSASANPVGSVYALFTLPSGVSVSSGAGDECFTAADGDWSWACLTPGVLSPGESWTRTLQLTSTRDHQPTEQTLTCRAKLRDHPGSIITAAGDTSFTVTFPAAS